MEDETGQLIREHLEDVESIQRYKTMHQTLVYLTHLDPADTEMIICEKLGRQVSCFFAFESCQFLVLAVVSMISISADVW